MRFFCCLAFNEEAYKVNIRCVVAYLCIYKCLEESVFLIAILNLYLQEKIIFAF